jgi:phosphatidate cytidylyltransferase
MPERADVPLTDGMALTLLGTLWVGLAIAHAIMLRELPHGDAIVIDVLVGTFVGDTAAYLGGRTFGTRPLAPRISPNKTLEGLGFGIAGAALAVWCAGLYQDWLGGWNALLLGFVVGLAAPLGDLFESK